MPLDSCARRLSGLLSALRLNVINGRSVSRQTDDGLAVLSGPAHKRRQLLCQLLEHGGIGRDSACTSWHGLTSMVRKIRGWQVRRFEILLSQNLSYENLVNS